MLTNVYLMSLPYITPSYEHVIDFGSISARNTFFTNNTLKTIQSNIKYDDNRVSLVVDMRLEEANNYDYLWYSGKNHKYFYFIVGIEYFTEKTTRYILELDVFTTYFYDIELMPSFVDRCHVDRWTDNGLPTANYQDEGIALGEYIIQENPTELADMYNSVIVSSSVPLGITENSSGAGSGDDYSGGSDSSMGSYGGTSWKDGKISAQGFRFIKGFEGFFDEPYQDSGGYWTIGYGTTKHGEPSVYEELASQAPITEEQASKAMYNTICSNYGAKILSACKNLGITEQYQFDALVSVAYNCGNGAVTGSNTLTEAIGSGKTGSELKAIWEKFRVTSKGEYLEGLYLRRVEEAKMFCGEEFEVRTIQNVTGDGWLPNDTSNMEDDSEEGVNGYRTTNNDFGNGWLIPVKSARVSSPYGWRNCPYHGREMHNGVDLACPKGTSILCPKGGTVITRAFHDSMGNYVKVKHGDITTIYMHMSAFSCNVGDVLKKGDKIGEVGSTGDSTGPHLHWEFRNGDNESCVPIPSMNKTGSSF